MKTCAITGASSGIGAATKQVLQKKGFEVFNIDLKDGDLNVNLATKDGRAAAIKALHEKYPDGLDALICCAGVSSGTAGASLIAAVNFYGATQILTGCFDLLEKKRGFAVAISSNSITQPGTPMHMVDMFLDVEDEDYVMKAIGDVTPENAHSIYTSSKYALALWVRRHAPSWAAYGVNLNAVAPGNVETPMTNALDEVSRTMMSALPVPTRYGTDKILQPDEIAQPVAFLCTEEARGVCGTVLFVDGGNDALLDGGRL